MKTLTELEQLLAAATPGEWDYTIQSNGLSSVYGNCQRDSMADADLIAFDLRNEHDAELIAEMKNALPALIECAEALEQCCSWLREYNVQMGPDTGLHMLQEQTESALAKLQESKS